MAQPSPPRAREYTLAPLNIDLILKVLNTTFLHPFVAWMIPLCLRAQATLWTALPMRLSIAYALALTLWHFLGLWNARVAYGLPREVDFQEEVVVITGGASGVGLLLAEVYGMRGASVAVLDVRELESGEARGVKAYRCDVGDADAVRRVAVEIEKDLGTPTILINNAGIVNGKPLLELSDAAIERTFCTNTLSAFYTIKTFLPGMLRHPLGGTIINISSVMAHLGAARLSDYSASKAALSSMHASLAAELRAHSKIKLVLVEPGQICTPLFAGVQSPNSFFAPVLDPVDVVREVIKAIEGGRSTRMAMPLYARWVAWMAVLPAGVQRMVRAVAGLDTAMEGFRGRGEAGLGASSERKSVGGAEKR